ncbi:metallophosphoesterase [Flavobacteriaceae bacterium F89]|uniref:Metallophosphoesterase n=1 Tax=Cerina litoralis TaxID=2874477 RepID=A0AAE3EWL8_9FLAO|nr:metallophosphoesterase [Cerina litoralis]MCG2462440.1 metallophosphoesterase [Cerina litoralis]
MSRSHHFTLNLIALFFVASQLSAQEKFKAPKLSDPDSWTMILLPDPQTYVKFERNQGIFELMTGWISEQVDSMNIKMVLCTGDLVEQNEMLVPDHVNGNQPSRNQWLAVSHALGRLDGKVPYILAAGNHDFGYKSAENRKSNYDDYFPAHKNLANTALLSAAAKNIDGKPTLEDAAFEFVSPLGRKFLFMNLEFAPRDTIIQWAKDITGQEKNADYTVAVLTHSYLNSKNEHIEKENYPLTDTNYGKAIWEKLVEPSQNIQLVFSGHIGSPDNFKEHVAFRTDKNAAGKKVNQMTFNAQAMGGGWQGNGGDGWLRILEFLPDGKTVNVHTFSPYFAISPSTRHLAWQKDSYNEFTFLLD